MSLITPDDVRVSYVLRKLSDRNIMITFVAYTYYMLPRKRWPPRVRVENALARNFARC